MTPFRFRPLIVYRDVDGYVVRLDPLEVDKARRAVLKLSRADARPFTTEQVARVSKLCFSDALFALRYMRRLCFVTTDATSQDLYKRKLTWRLVAFPLFRIIENGSLPF